MTKEEAIKELKALKADYWDDDGYGRETIQYYDTMLALNMAIEALKQQPCEDDTFTTRRAAMCRLEYEKWKQHLIEEAEQEE